MSADPESRYTQLSATSPTHTSSDPLRNRQGGSMAPPPESCCGFFSDIFRRLGGHVPPPDRASPLEQRNFQEYRYHAPEVVGPVSCQREPQPPVDEAVTEERRLLPKAGELSAAVEVGRSRSDQDPQPEAKRRSTGDPQSSAEATAAQQQQHAALHRRVKSVGDAKHRRSKGLSGGSASEVLPSTTAVAAAAAPVASKAAAITASQDEDDDFCPTCLDTYTTENPKIFTECGHHFHMPCIYAWLERSDTCPMCGSTMSAPGLA